MHASNVLIIPSIIRATPDPLEGRPGLSSELQVAPKTQQNETIGGIREIIINALVAWNQLNSNYNIEL